MPSCIRVIRLSSDIDQAYISSFSTETQSSSYLLLHHNEKHLSVFPSEFPSRSGVLLTGIMDVRPVLCVLLVVVATSYAQTRRCCYPDQFVTSQGIQVGYTREGRGGVMYENSSIAFDYTNKRVGMIGNRIDNEQRLVDSQVIYDYKEGVEYRIEPKMRRCEKRRLERPMAHCVSEGATFLQSIYLGDHKLTVDSFLVSYKTERGAVQGSLTVTQGDCLPSSSLLSGKEDNVSFMALTGFFNYVSGIKDPSRYFTVPEFCRKMITEEPMRYDEFPNMLFL
ncbi:development-specific protein LVN1.2-like [Acanthaster planci]|uniref:Development-specific protein LVN1.2-like n=1 Tax=Acanthaster planci TaxID=133434 RepID=A0A8B7XVK1_ACAPL|nr:development-specific protein LVN1.2-like [Acanthaster planci]